MHALMTAAQNEAGKAFDVGGLVVPVIAGVVAIVVAIYNTRGETAALRRLKAMNDVIEKLPENSDVLTHFAAARDDLAQRVAARMTEARRAASRWASLWGLGIIGAALFGGLIWTAYQYFPAGYSAAELISNVAAGAALGALTFVGVARLIEIWSKLRGLEREAAQLAADLRRGK